MAALTIGAEDKVFYRKYSGNFQVEYFRYNNTKLCGIYTITNIDNGKVYVGQTMCYRDRAAGHRRDLKNQKHGNKYLQRAYNKGQNFIMQFIENCTIDELDNREEFWIHFLNGKKDGYNLTIGGKSPRGYKHTEKWKKENSDRMRIYQKINKIDRSLSYKPVLCYCAITGNFIKEYQSITEASSITRVPLPTISGNINNRTPRCGNFIFKEKLDKYPLKIDVSCIKRRDKKDMMKNVVQYSGDLIIKVWTNWLELEQYVNKGRTSIQRSIIRSKKFKFNDYKFVYE